MYRSTKITTIRRASFGVGAALLIGSGLAMAAPVAQTPAAAQASGLAVEVSTTEHLVDGQQIDVTVTLPPGARASSQIGGAGSIRICRDGPTYAAPADLQVPAGNCPDVNISGSASVANRVSLYRMPGTDDRVVKGTYQVGTGAVEWSRGANRWTLDCDSENPCRLVVEVRDDGNRPLIDASTLLTFDDSTPYGACGGSSPDALDTGGSDRFIDTWSTWTRKHCEASGSRAATTAVLMGEGMGLDSFAAGHSDLVYSATGPTMPGRPVTESREAISVPVGVNAAVIALIGGRIVDAPDWPIGLRRPFGQVRVTADEMATLFGQAVHGMVATGVDERIVARNPALRDLPGLHGPVAAPAASDAVTYLTTRWFDTRAGGSWLTSPIVDPPSAPRGVLDEFSNVEPPFEEWIMEMYSARATLKKLVADDANVLGGGTLKWLLTDLATAEQLGLPMAEIQNSRGEWVAPTTDSLMRKVATMEKRPDGTFISGTGPDAEGAYPLAFVEHAVVAAKPDCASPKQAVLTDWLTYITGPGQADLVGMLPLTGDLVTASEAARAKVVDACKPVTPPTTTTTPTPTPPAAPPGPGGLPPGGDFGAGFGDLFGSDSLGDFFAGADLGGGFDGGGGVGGGGFGDDGRLDGSGVEDSDSELDGDDAQESEDSDMEPDVEPVTGKPGGRGSAGVLALLGLAFMGAGAGSLSRSSRKGAGAPS